MRMTSTFDEMWGRGMGQSQGQRPDCDDADPGPGAQVQAARPGWMTQAQTMYEGLRPPYRAFDDWLRAENPARFLKKQREAEEVFRLTGITFNVYGRAEAAERLIPFDIIPRIISGREWARLSRGIEQRVRAGRIPVDMIARNAAFLLQMIGVEPPGGVYTHVVGIDLVRTTEDEFFVLEDNARTPSSVSYMLENRETMFQMSRDVPSCSPATACGPSRTTR